MPGIRRLSWISLLLLPVLACGGCRPPSEPTIATDAAESAEVDVAEELDEAPSCEEAVGWDDGSFETGYGFVPSATWGLYLQQFDSEALGGTEVRQVCVCWLKTRGDADVDFEVVFHVDVAGLPEREAYASVPGRAVGVATSREEAGPFTAVDVESVDLPPGKSWIGVRWNPSEEKFLFVCADHGSEEGEPLPIAPVVFAEDRAKGWADARSARDPIFSGHRAIGVRVAVTP